MVNGLGTPNNNRFSAALYGQQQYPDGLILQTPPKAKFSQKSFGDIVEGQIVSDRNSSSQGKKNNSNQQDTNSTNASRDHLAYTNAYAGFVKAQVRASTTEQNISRANMTELNLNQPITQKQFLALNQKLDTIGGKLDQLNSLLGFKSTNTEALNLKKASLIDNQYGNSQIDIA